MTYTGGGNPIAYHGEAIRKEIDRLADELSSVCKHLDDALAERDQLRVEVESLNRANTELGNVAVAYKARIDKALGIADGAILDIQRNMMPTPILDLDAIRAALTGEE